MNVNTQNNGVRRRIPKEGAALVIVLGFLAILTVTIIAFTAQTRTDRIAGRAFASKAQTTHLLNTALTRAMKEVDTQAGNTSFPPFFAFSSQHDSTDIFLIDTQNFSTQEEFFPYGNTRLRKAYLQKRDTAEWQPIYSDSNVIGRIGYIVINTSGLLDANEVGGITTNDLYTARSAGTSPSEIQLSNHKLIIDELNASRKTFPHISPEHPGGQEKSAAAPDLSAGLAFVHNREQAWKRFETIRDIKQLSNIGSLIFTGDIASFSTYSFDPREDNRTFMGTNSATLNLDAVKNELPKTVDADFLINQLRDYVDPDTLPQDSEGNYTDYSVEPVPLINECIFSLGTTFIPNEVETKDGNTELDSVTVSNTLSLNIEVWYPFCGYTNSDQFGFGFSGIDFESTIQTPDLSSPLLGDLLDWNDSMELDSTATIPGYEPVSYDIYSTNIVVEVAPNTGALTELFEGLATNIVFGEIYCTNLTQNQKVDSVKNLTLDFENYVPTIVLPEISQIDSNLFVYADYQNYTNDFEFGMATIDPRLNWDGTHSNQWVGVDENGYYEAFPSLNDYNSDLIESHNPVDPPDYIYVRNKDRIDSPYELTYFLYSTNRPWNSVQLFPPDDGPTLGEIVKNLSPYDGNQPRSGRINPYTTHTNVIASAYMNMPINEYEPEHLRRLNATEATQAATVFMSYIKAYGWPTSTKEYGNTMYQQYIKELIGDSRPWAVESFFRNTYELFNPRDTQFTAFLIAQSGIDTDGNGRIDNDEVLSTQQAVSYVWRDPKTGRAAPYFFGLQDSLLKSTDQAGSWSELLKAFEP